MARSQTLHEYNISKLNLVFAILAVLTVITTIGMVVDDYNRSWKHHQREYRAMERERLEAQRAEAQEALSDDALAEAQAELTAAQELVAQRKDASSAVQKELHRVGGEYYSEDQGYRFLKAEHDVVKYNYQLAEDRHDEAESASLKQQLMEMDAELDERRLRVEAKTAERDSIEGELAKLRQEVTDAETKVSDLTGKVSDLETKIAAVGPSFANTFRNLPMLDFIDPSLKVRQLAPAGLSYDVNFGTTDRIDRCTTCHLAIDRAGWEDAPQPYTTHPNLDLYVSANSPHSMTDFGCTECHGGRPRAVEFSRAVHTPSDPEEEERWKKEHGWYHIHLWEWPMHRSDNYEAACFKCHSDEREIAGADRYNRGRKLVEHFGCYGCHVIDGYEDIPKRGPSLERLARKMTPDFANRWIHNPKEIRPQSAMPRIFHLPNVEGEQDGDPTYWSRRTQAEVAGVVAYLFDKSEDGRDALPGPLGDPVQGKVLFEAVGCEACHIVGDEEGAYDATTVSERQFGPNLAGVADKTNAGWLYNWIRDPKAYDPTTRMPSLRLTEEEALDITAWLMTLKSNAPDTAPARSGAESEMVDAVLMEYLSNTQPVSVARAQVDAMNSDERMVALGEKIIGRQGCYGCHWIEGFEKSLPIGTELSQEGSKPVHKFAFGNVHDIPHTAEAWLKHKMLEPRSFDKGVYLQPLEKLRMPQFDMTEAQSEAIVTNLLSWTENTVPMNVKDPLTPREAMIAKGERLVTDRNCRGCHIIEGRGGTITAQIEDQGYWPPNLYRQGAKVQPDWLVRFLHEPFPIRPWMDVRMPSFQFTGEEKGAIANYFMALAEVEDHPYPQADLEEYPKAAEGAELFTMYQCLQCHPTEIAEGAPSASELAPNLSIAAGRLRPEWIVDWLRDPQSQMPGTKMPNFFYEDEEYFFDEAPEQMEALRDYLMTLTP